MDDRQKTALIAMSGGVDSSVAAALTLEAGYRCIGATMKLHDGDPDTVREKACCTLADAEDARQVCRKLGIPYHVFDHTAEFGREVIDRFVSAYERGETPNPCIDCNRYMKFSRLYERARLLGCDKIVTGHYCRIVLDPAAGRYRLLKAKNLDKDQSYVLYFLTQEQLAHTLFPLGDLESKEEVRLIAERHGFLNARKRDSQDICFVENGKYADFIRRRTGHDYPPGDFVDREGHVLGQHRGIIGYTIGQRRGLGLSLPAPLYVCRKDVPHNAVVLSPEDGLYSTALTADEVNWIAGQPPAGPIRARARTRYSAKEAPATVTPLPDGRITVTFDTPQRAVTVGQAVVLYDGDEVLGGGRVEVAADQERS